MPDPSSRRAAALIKSNALWWVWLLCVFGLSAVAAAPVSGFWYAFNAAGQGVSGRVFLGAFYGVLLLGAFLLLALAGWFGYRLTARFVAATVEWPWWASSGAAIVVWCVTLLLIGLSPWVLAVLVFLVLAGQCSAYYYDEWRLA
jgi:hypothetical protein